MNNAEHYYKVSVKWEADRRGTLSSPILNQEIEVATPPEFPKGIEGVWSPEHLFVASVNSCLMTTFLSIAENSKLEYLGFESKAIGKLEIVDGKYMISEITIVPIVTVIDKASEAKAEKVLQKAEANCLISNSVKSKIHFLPEIKIAEVRTVEMSNVDYEGIF
ncbi:MAG TPA: OsmC family protein [Bacteroidia bacterium]|jgi:peroxiredoxin-like protein|nr:OsmC family protein [Bacteroidia bacterium]